MRISFTLNGNPVEADIEPNRRVSDVLKNVFNCRSLYLRCNRAICGSCLILFDNQPMFSCILPAFELRSHELWTAEGISTLRGYKNILEGFTQAGARLCSLCAASRTVTTEALLRLSLQPDQNQLMEAADSVSCDCTSSSRILDAMLKAAQYREKDLHDT